MRKLLTIIMAIAVLTGVFGTSALAAVENALSERTVTVTGDINPYNAANQLRKAYDSNASSLYVSKGNGEAKTLIVDLGEAKEIDAINVLYNYSANSWYLASAEVYPGCADGSYDFLQTPVYSSTEPVIDVQSKTYFLGFNEPVTARYFKLVLTPGSSASLRVAELEFLNRSENLLNNAEIEMKASATSKTHEAFPENNLFDGSLYTRWATGSKNNAWTITADFGSEKTVNYIDMTDFGETVTGIDIYTSSDGITYGDTPAASITRELTGATASVTLSYTFAPVTARYMKVVLNPVSAKSMTMWDFGLYNKNYQEQFEKDIDDNVTFKTDGNIITSVADGVLSADITVTNSSSNTAYPVSYIMNVWSGNNLIDTQIYEGTLAAGGTESFTLTSVDTTGIEDLEVNLYRWDSMKNIKPYTRVYDLPGDISGEGVWTVAGGMVGETTSVVDAVCDASLETSWTPGNYAGTGFFLCTLDSAKTVNTIRVVQGASSAINSFVVEYSNDGKTFERCYDGTGMNLKDAQDGSGRITFAPVEAKYFRFFINKQAASYEICELELLNEVY